MISHGAIKFVSLFPVHQFPCNSLSATIKSTMLQTWSSLCVLPLLPVCVCVFYSPSLSLARPRGGLPRSHLSLAASRVALSCLPCIQFPLSNCRGGSRSRTLAFYYPVLQSARSELLILLEAASRLVRSWKCWNLENCVKFGNIQGCRTGLKERQERFWGRNNRLLLCGSWWDSWLY